MKCFLIFIFAISCMRFSDACSCFPGPPGWEVKTYCETGFGGTFKVLGPSYSCGNPLDMKICYPIEVVQQFRGAPISPSVLETNDSSAACGIYLNVGGTYFVATNPVDDNTFGVYLCGLLEEWTTKTCCEMIAEAKKYDCSNIKPTIKPVIEAAAVP